MQSAARAGRSRRRAAPPTPAPAAANAARGTARARAAAPATWLWGVRQRQTSRKLSANTALSGVVRYCARSRHPVDTHAQYRPDGPAPLLEQHLHDVCLVRALEGAQSAAVDHRCARELGYRVLRVHAAGARQSHRLHRALGRSAEADPRGHHARRVRTVRGLLLEGAAEARLPLGRALHHGRRVLRLPEPPRGRLTGAQRRRGSRYAESKLARFGMTTFGSVVASMTASCSMMPFNASRYAVTA